MHLEKRTKPSRADLHSQLSLLEDVQTITPFVKYAVHNNIRPGDLINSDRACGEFP